MPIVFNTPIMFLSLFFTICRAFKTEREMLLNHALVVGVFWLFKIPSSTSHTLSYFNLNYLILNEISVLLGSLAGLAIALARLSNKTLLMELYTKLCLRKSSERFLKTQTRITGKNYLRMPLDSSFMDDMDDTYQGFYYSDIYDSITVCVIST